MLCSGNQKNCTRATAAHARTTPGEDENGTPALLEVCDFVFVAGDLNYRVDASREELDHAMEAFPGDEAFDELVRSQSGDLPDRVSPKLS